MGLLVAHWATGTLRAVNDQAMHGTFAQRVILCMIMAFLTAGLFEWAKLFIEGADDALNKGYKHHSPLQVDMSH
jgi:DNA polymerase sigma